MQMKNFIVTTLIGAVVFGVAIGIYKLLSNLPNWIWLIPVLLGFCYCIGYVAKLIWNSVE
jgi:uncharacterized membrane protein